jgi:hypothetical protein
MAHPLEDSVTWKEDVSNPLELSSSLTINDGPLGQAESIFDGRECRDIDQLLCEHIAQMVSLQNNRIGLLQRSLCETLRSDRRQPQSISKTLPRPASRKDEKIELP